MKPFYFFPLAIILLLSAAFSFTSCKKDKVEQFKLTLTVGDGGTVKAYSNEARTTPITNLLAIDKGTKVYLKAEPTANAVIQNWTGIDGDPIDAAKTLAAVTMNSNKTVTINFTVSQSVRFDSNGGSTIGNQLITPGSKITKPANPTKTGNAFVGWYKEVTLITPWNFDTDVVGTQSVTLYAKWTDQFYTITLDANGGTQGLKTTVEVPHDGTQDPTNMPEGTEPTRTNYVFAGWYKEAGAATPWTSTDKVTSDMTLYAKWVALRTITFSSNGGSSVGNLSIKEGEFIVKPTDPTKTGYTFNYWNKNIELTSEWLFNTDKVAGVDITLYAKWTANTYTVVYSGGDGATGTTATSTHTYDVEKSLTTNGFSRTGYIFYKWETTSEVFYTDGESVLNLATTHNAVFNLTAQWTKASYKVTFNENNPAAATDEVENLPTDATVDYDAMVTAPTTVPTLAGYLFIGWYKEATCSNEWVFDTDKMPASELTLYARWAKSHTLNLYNNDGTTDNNQTNYPEGVEKTLPTTITREHYTFDGWNTMPNGTGTNFTTSYTIGSADATLYANWRYTGNYATGDYYPDPNVEYDFDFGNSTTATSGTPAIGIVFETTGTTGKIMSLNEGSKRWYDKSRNNNDPATLLDADSDADGYGNTTKIMEEANANLSYPAAAWCVAKIDGGKNWYLPAITELSALYNEDNNTKLIAAGGTIIDTTKEYCSSTELNAASIRTINSSGTSSEAKSVTFNVRAVAAF